MTRTVTTICDYCKQQMDDGFSVSYHCSQIPMLNQTTHFCSYDHLKDYLLEKFKDAEPHEEE